MTVTATPTAPLVARGVTVVAPVVFERIAARAAAEVDGVEGTVSSGLARFLPWTDDAPVEAEVSLNAQGQDSVALDLTLNVAYPRPVAQVAERVRDHVIERIGALTGRPVRRVDITVVDLVAPAPRRVH